jgi:hypothetical protein
MCDLVKRLYEESQDVTDSLYYQAADTIEQLRDELAALREQEPVAKAKDGNLFWVGDPKEWRGVDIDLYTEPKPAIPELLAPKGETVPQTVENLQAIMARDAAEMLLMKEEISKLTQNLNQARQKQPAIPEGLVEIHDRLLSLSCYPDSYPMDVMKKQLRDLQWKLSAMLAAQQGGK